MPVSVYKCVCSRKCRKDTSSIQQFFCFSFAIIIKKLYFSTTCYWSLYIWASAIKKNLLVNQKFLYIKEIQDPCIMMNGPVKSGTELFSTVTEHSSLCLCWMRTCMSICMCSCVTLPTCCGGLAQSVIQVRSTGSGLMHIGSALSGSRPSVQGVCGAQAEKRTQSNTPALHHEVLPNAQKTLIYPGMMTKLNALDPSEEQ